MPEWHSSWKRMKHLDRARDYLTWSEFQQRLEALGFSLSRYHVRLALAASPPARAYGNHQFERHHVRLAAAYARSKGLITTKGAR